MVRDFQDRSEVNRPGRDGSKAKTQFEIYKGTSVFGLREKN